MQAESRRAESVLCLWPHLAYLGCSVIYLITDQLTRSRRRSRGKLMIRVYVRAASVEFNSDAIQCGDTESRLELFANYFVE